MKLCHAIHLGVHSLCNFIFLKFHILIQLLLPSLKNGDKSTIEQEER